MSPDTEETDMDSAWTASPPSEEFDTSLDSCESGPTGAVDGLEAGQRSTGGRNNRDGMADLDGTAASVETTTTSPWAGNRPTAFGELLADEDAWPQ